MSKVFSATDVGAHKTKADLWVIVDEDVYDLTKFQDEHPGIPSVSSNNESFTNIHQAGKKVRLGRAMMSGL